MTVHVVRAGMATTVQDLGRPGHQHSGVPEGGAMDRHTARLLNLLVGNDEGDALLECTMTGPELRLARECVVAVGGADMEASLDGSPVPSWRSVHAGSGSVLRLGAARSGCRAYVAFGGGIDVPVVLGSRSTYAPARFGGLAGRPLRNGDALPLGAARGAGAAASRSLAPASRPRQDTTLRFVRGPHFALLGDGARAAFLASGFRLSPESDRMGCRLVGPAIPLAGAGMLSSAPVTMGTIQLPSGGAPIVLMADRQTTGGYPMLGQVATVDLGIVAQLRPGDTLRFAEIPLAEAETLFLERERTIQGVRRALALSP